MSFLFARERGKGGVWNGKVWRELKSVKVVLFNRGSINEADVRRRT